jgi:hypothetical protein
LSPKFGFFKRKTSDNFYRKNGHANAVQAVTRNELQVIIDKEKKLVEKDLVTDLEPARKSVMECIYRLRGSADELEEQEIKVENPQFESLINNSKRILIASIKKESFIESSEIKGYEDALKFKNNLELLINRFGQVGDSHNRILNEFMRKQINKLKNEFDNLSSLLKQVTKILSVKESEINKSIICGEDLHLFNEKVNEIKEKRERLSDLNEERANIDKLIEKSKTDYDHFKRSQEFQITTDTLKKINEKKNNIDTFEKNMINMVSGLSRPITKFSYLASKETQRRLMILQNQPLEIFSNESNYIQIFHELRKQIGDKSIQVKDPEKTINQIDGIIDSLPSLSSNLKNLRDGLTQLESSLNSKNLRYLEDMKTKKEMYEKYRSENISKIEEMDNSINELESNIEILKKKIEENVSDITNRNYSIQLSDI